MNEKTEKEMTGAKKTPGPEASASVNRQED